MWLTEFGVIWGYDGLEWRQVDGAWRAIAKGTYRADLIRNPTWWDRALHRMRRTVIGWLTPRSEARA